MRRTFSNDVAILDKTRGKPDSTACTMLNSIRISDSQEEASSGYTLALYSKTCTDLRKTVDR
jgi:hypothetical protein